ncbi:5'-nucleotidase domain protein [Gregarina niphandrodes]|uniref:5'-nucleotidase domain protein n=1 Tax=Gregarina niphandrodes TaxID=110365 RepID=A0A023BBK3_GRENI|nr:5'-nucleotidase domain protein [Gregarina niphandrodes]EZG79938.1 5'-nucleotidase domain protein [Gregarina niphandrodes]|eukprot:XP_011134357.1 5'-nucleotidase domain protein [Gregarina niphandrodes]
MGSRAQADMSLYSRSLSGLLPRAFNERIVELRARPKSLSLQPVADATNVQPEELVTLKFYLKDNLIEDSLEEENLAFLPDQVLARVSVEFGEDLELVSTSYDVETSSLTVQVRTADDIVAGSHPVTVNYRQRACVSNACASNADEASSEDEGTERLVKAVAHVHADSEVEELHVFEFNDIHGRIGSAVEGANAQGLIFAGKLLAEMDGKDAVLLSAGDNIGASVFASAMNNDTPLVRLETLVGLQASVVGNHEYDQGWAALQTRLVEEWEGMPMLAGNVKLRSDGSVSLPLSTVVTSSGGDYKVCVSGVVTTETPSMVSPAGIADLDFQDAAETIKAAERVKDATCDASILLVHQGAPQDDPENTYMDDVLAGDSEFARVVSAGASFDAILSGHTHHYYQYLKEREGALVQPIIQTGCYAARIGHITLTFNKADRKLTQVASELIVVDPATEAENLPGWLEKYPELVEIRAMLDEAFTKADEAGNEQVGTVDGAIPNDMDRSHESPLADLVADGLRYVCQIAADNNAAESGTQSEIVQAAFMNPGGVRVPIDYKDDGVVTYRDVFNVLPFANTIVCGNMTPQAIYDTLEYQWNTLPHGTDGQTAGRERNPLILGVSGLVYEYDVSKPEEQRVVSVLLVNNATGMTTKLDRTDDTTQVLVATNDFLAAGGDSFLAVARTKAEDWRQSGYSDSESLVKYIQDHSPVQSVFQPRSTPSGWQDVTDTVAITAGCTSDRFVLSVNSPDADLDTARVFLSNHDDPASNDNLLAVTPIGQNQPSTFYVSGLYQNNVTVSVFSELFSGNPIPQGVSANFEALCATPTNQANGVHSLTAAALTLTILAVSCM